MKKVPDSETQMTRGAVVLCGGKSSRMGQDKATLMFGPELMLQRVIRLISSVADPGAIVIVAASGQTLPDLPADVIVTTDERPGRGPLEGLAAGLRGLPKSVEAAFVTSCDVPLLVPEFVIRMFEQLGEYDVAVPRDGEFYHPLAAVYRPRVVEAIDRLLSLDQLRASLLFGEVRTREVPVAELRRVDPGLSTLMNLNRPEDYQAALKIAGFAMP